MMLIAIFFAAVAFYEILVMLNAIANVAAMRSTVNHSFEVIRSTTLADEQKGQALRKASVLMFSSVALVLLKFAGAAVVAAGALFVSSLAGGWPIDRLLNYSVSPVAIATTLAALALYGFVRHGRRR